MTLLLHSVMPESLLSCAPFNGGRGRRLVAGAEPRPVVRPQVSPPSDRAAGSHRDFMTGRTGSGHCTLTQSGAFGRSDQAVVRFTWRAKHAERGWHVEE